MLRFLELVKFGRNEYEYMKSLLRPNEQCLCSDNKEDTNAFTKLMRSVGVPEENTVRYFQTFDYDRNGKLTPTELLLGCAILDPCCSMAKTTGKS